MNRKHLILLALPALMLSGCNKEISAADAKVKAKEIAEHEAKVEDYKALTITTSTKAEASGKVEGEEGHEKSEMKASIEFSTEKNYAHVSSYMVEEDVKNEKKDTYDTESWTYLQDDVLYVVNRVNDGEKETKTYTKISGVGDVVKESFQKALDGVVKQAFGIAASKEYLEAVEKVADGESFEGGTYDVKYYTAGDGNLTVEGTATFTDYKYMGFKGNGNGKVKYAWDQYLLTEIAVSMNITMADAESDTNATLSMEMGEQVKFECNVAYPNLDDYTPLLG